MTATDSLHLSATRITAAIGVELTGLDLRRPPTPKLAAVLRDVVDRHHVIVVRDQFLEARQLQSVAESLGTIVFSPVQRAIGSTTAVSTIEDTAERPPAGFGRHTDLSWTPEPPALGFLTAVTIPPYGGDTLWASTAAIFDNLSDADQRKCDALTTIHAPDTTLLASIERHHGGTVADMLRAQHPPIEHALVRAHPTNGSPQRVSLAALRPPSRRPRWKDNGLMQPLNTALDDPHMQMRWRWRQGDLVIYLIKRAHATARSPIITRNDG